MEPEAIQDRIAFHLENGTRGAAAILLFTLPDGRRAVVCMDDDPDQDAAVNRDIEGLFKMVCDRHQLNPREVVWIERSEKAEWKHLKAGGWELVEFDPPGSGKRARWIPMTEETWQALGITPPQL